MPIIHDIEIEVYCDTCGSNISFETEFQNKYGERQFRVKVCPDCMEEKDKEIKELEGKIDDLEDQLGELQATI